jgi:hypothetical protein
MVEPSPHYRYGVAVASRMTDTEGFLYKKNVVAKLPVLVIQLWKGSTLYADNIYQKN